jgi:hypothetical protein
MSWVRNVLLLGVIVLLAGCQEGQAVKAPSKQDPLTMAKMTLQEVEKTGQIGSKVGGLKYSVADLKATDPTKAEIIESGAKTLSELGNNPAKAKAVAKEILSKL